MRVRGLEVRSAFAGRGRHELGLDAAEEVVVQRHTRQELGVRLEGLPVLVAVRVVIEDVAAWAAKGSLIPCFSPLFQ